METRHRTSKPLWEAAASAANCCSHWVLGCRHGCVRLHWAQLSHHFQLPLSPPGHHVHPRVRHSAPRDPEPLEGSMLGTGAGRPSAGWCPGPGCPCGQSPRHVAPRCRRQARRAASSGPGFPLSVQDTAQGGAPASAHSPRAEVGAEGTEQACSPSSGRELCQPPCSRRAVLTAPGDAGRRVPPPSTPAHRQQQTRRRPPQQRLCRATEPQRLLSSASARPRSPSASSPAPAREGTAEVAGRSAELKATPLDPLPFF